MQVPDSQASLRESRAAVQRVGPGTGMVQAGVSVVSGVAVSFVTLSTPLNISGLLPCLLYNSDRNM